MEEHDWKMILRDVFHTSEYTVTGRVGRHVECVFLEQDERTLVFEDVRGVRTSLWLRAVEEVTLEPLDTHGGV